jgi:hypothetical protein
MPTQSHSRLPAVRGWRRDSRTGGTPLVSSKLHGTLPRNGRRLAFRSLADITTGANVNQGFPLVSSKCTGCTPGESSETFTIWSPQGAGSGDVNRGYPLVPSKYSGYTPWSERRDADRRSPQVAGSGDVNRGYPPCFVKVIGDTSRCGVVPTAPLPLALRDAYTPINARIAEKRLRRCSLATANSSPTLSDRRRSLRRLGQRSRCGL